MNIRAVFCEIWRVFLAKWFWFASIGTVIFLWLGLGSESYYMLQSSEIPLDMLGLLQTTMTSESTALSLPALAALPAAAVALAEMRTGIFRAKVFRAGRCSWRTGKIGACMVSAVLSQLLGVLIFIGVLFGLTLKNGSVEESAVEGALWGAIGARLLASVAFACFGSTIAVLTGSSASAYVAPMAACFTLKLLGSRFFLDVQYIDPLEWMSGDKNAIKLLLILCVIMIIAQDLALRREMKRHA